MKGSGAGQIAKPNLFIVGAPKCGTTAWHRYLSTHPDIFFSEMKEPNYFAFDMPGIRWVPKLGAYEALFRRGGKAKVRGEASAIYLYSTVSAKAIREYNPDAKILIFLRDQEEFLPSWHHQLLFRFAEDIQDFETAWRLSGKRTSGNIPKTCLEPRLLDYAAVADFRAQVERYLSAFPRKQILVIDFDEWTADPRSTYLRILGFLGLEDDGRTDFPRINEAKSYRVKWVGRLIARPPGALRSAAKLLRKVMGRDALGLGVKAASLFSAPGYTTSISPKLREQIILRYADGNRILRQKLRLVKK
jgi:hypothetical protein